MSELQLPVLPAAAPAITHERYAALARRAKLLSWLSLAWMTVEGTVAIVAGVAAGRSRWSGSGWTPPSRASPAW